MQDNISQFVHDWSQLITIAVVIVACIIINRIIHWVLTGLAKRSKREERPWRHALLIAPDAPLRVVVWLIGLTIIVNMLSNIHDLTLVNKFFPPTRQVLDILLVGWWLFRIVNRVKENLLARAKHQGEEMDATAVEAVSKLCWIVIFVVLVLVIFQSLGFSIAGLLAFGGAAGIAVGFAAQSLVSNLFGGLTIFASRIFKLGEYIIIPGTDLMGEVRHIGWRSTLVMGFNRKPFYVPNSKFNDSAVINHSRAERRCIQQYIHLGYGDLDKVETILRRCNEMIEADERVDQEFFVFRFDAYGDLSLRLFLYAFGLSTSYVDYMVLKEDLLLGIANIIREEGGEILPVTNVKFPGGVPQIAATE